MNALPRILLFIFLFLIGLQPEILAQPADLIIKQDGSYTSVSIAEREKIKLSELHVGYESNLTDCSAGLIMPAFKIWYEADQNTHLDWQVRLTISILDNNNIVVWSNDLTLDHTKLEVMNHLFYQNYIDCTVGYKFRITGKTVTAPNGHQAELEGDVYFNFALFQQVETSFDQYATSDLTFGPSSDLQNISWGVISGAVEYELQLAFVNQKDDPQPASDNDAMQNWPVTSLRTTSPNANILMKYPQGELYLRVRGWGKSNEQLIPGSWSSIASLSIADQNQQQNWQMVNSFAENGRNKKVITYFDATGRARQVKTYLASQQQTIVAETMYDKEGREVVQTLPAPVDSDNLDFTQLFNYFDGDSDYVDKEKYDNGDAPNATMVGGATDYYSSKSKDLYPMLPDAAGYVYSHTSFANDNTGRVRRQAGVGEVFKESFANDNHNTRYFYGGASQAELTRLFGDQVGEANHYRKNLVVDPNQQVSVSYLDREGRTVATGLAGNAPSELDELPSNTGGQPITILLNDKNNKTGNVSLINHPISNVSPGSEYTLTYTINPDIITECTSCYYDLQMYVVDPRGNRVNIIIIEDGGANLSDNIITYSNLHCDMVTTSTIQFNFTANQVGDFRVHKELLLKPLSYEDITEIAGLEAASEITNAQQQIQDEIDESICEPCEADMSQTNLIVRDEELEVCGEDLAEILQEAMQSSVGASCENYRFQLIEKLVIANETVTGASYNHFFEYLDYYLTEEAIEDETIEEALIDEVIIDETIEEHCAYKLCLSTSDSRSFDMMLSMSKANEAKIMFGDTYEGVVQQDPFFQQNPQFFDQMVDNLNSISITSNLDPEFCGTTTGTITASIYEIANPDAAGLKLNQCLEPDPTAQHFFYQDDLTQVNNDDFPEDDRLSIEERSWTYFKAYYEKAKREYLKQIVSDCPILLEELEARDQLPSSIEEAFAVKNNLDDFNINGFLDGFSYNGLVTKFFDRSVPCEEEITIVFPFIDCQDCNTLTFCKNPALNFNFALDNLEQLKAEREAACKERLQEEADWHQDRVEEEIVEAKASELWSSYQASCYAAGLEDIKYTTQYQEYHYTLYFYDQGGNLMRTVPPNGVDEFLQTGEYSFVTNYRYNSLNQLTWQETPDAGNSRFYYNDKEQLRLSQNAKQQAASTPEYSYTKYDVHSRISEVGWFASSEPIADLVDKINDADFPAEADYELKEITRTFYDLPAGTLPVAFAQQYLRSRVSYVQVWEDETTLQTSTYYSYDPHGNVESLLQDIPGLEPKRIDYVYDLASGNVNYVMYQYGQPDQLMHRYGYDDDNRITAVATSTDGFVWETDAHYEYYPHGPLKTIDLGEDQVQSVDYYYTLQGWLKGINEPLRDQDPTKAKDAFGVVLGYHANDYKPVDNTITLTENRDQLWQAYDALPDNSTGLYNGNIAWMNTHLPGVDPEDKTKGNQAMLYRYDQLNRIKAARSLTNYNGSFSSRDNSPKAYDTDYTYDGNGNLLTLERRDQNAELIASFDYLYEDGNNQLTSLSAVGTAVKVFDYMPSSVEQQHLYKKIKLQNFTLPAGATVHLEATDEIEIGEGFVVEAGANFSTAYVAPDPNRAPVDEYDYDEIGNLVADNTRQTEIAWTVYGKVKKVTHTGNGQEVTFTYDGAGNRVSKAVTSGTTTTTTHYLRDASGNVMAIYNDTQLAEQPIYGSSRLGQYTGRPEPGKRIWQRKKYELSNHLGNVLAVVGDGYTTTSGDKEAWISSLQDYYPFGLAMEGRSSNLDNYRYGFNGKERDPATEWGQTSYDYGFRIYNPGIGKFLSVDPLTKEYPFYSPYQYASDNPILNIDLDGLEGKISILASDVSDGLPELRTHQGELIKIVTVEANNVVHTPLKQKAIQVAIKNLKKGRLISADGRTFTTTRMFEYDVYDLDGKLYKNLERGVNFGTKKTTTKGINQLTAFTNRSIPKKLLGLSKFLGVAASGLPAAEAIIHNDAGKLNPIGFVVEDMLAEMESYHDEVTDKLVQQAASSGIEDVNNLFDTNDFVNDGYLLESTSVENLYNIFIGDINEYGKLLDSNHSNDKKEVDLLFKKDEDENLQLKSVFFKKNE